jgi:excisionase family DNA binding protein
MSRKRPEDSPVDPAPAEDGGVDEVLTELLALRERVEESERLIAELRAAAQAQKEILDIDGAAALLDVHRRTVERLIKAKKIPYARLHAQRGVRFIRTDLMAWLRRGCPQQGTTRLNSRRRASPPACGNASKEPNSTKGHAPAAEEG